MSKAYLAAKEKYQAVIDDAGRGDYVCRTNRIGASRMPTKGDCHMINRVDHPERRRSSTGSSTGGMSERIRNLLNRPAY
ncbi:hypothetical protein F4809DRAFT_175983 [Biscogniauxia mediterranea]|nr:hypothetical protein F5X96DRAFT_670002 [Biscogniauxia mediterranea]KAI1639208.1 hypothetical protein F4809DRAFT_175983 [Biscogniauxia mediterranea]